MSTSRGRPPRLLCLAGGIIGATMAHCSSVRSEGYIFRDRFSFNIIAHSSTDGICANYLTNLLLCQSLFPDSLLVMDGSVVGRDCTALMIHVIYKGRALPLAWRVRQGPKGHFPEDLHIAVVALMREVIPEGATVVFLRGRRVRRDNASGHAERGGLVLRLPHGPEHRGDVGGRDLPPRYLGGV